MNLKAPESYLKATPEEKAKICNGAGAAGWGWTVPDTLWGLCITEAANIHDWMYHFGKMDDDKREADMTFLKNMYILIQQGSWWFRAIRRNRARVYYNSVKYAGHWAFWDGKQVPANIEKKG